MLFHTVLLCQHAMPALLAGLFPLLHGFILMGSFSNAFLRAEHGVG